MDSLCKAGVVRCTPIILFIVSLVGMMMVFSAGERVEAQVRISATPLSAVLPQAQLQSVQQEVVFASPTPTATETPEQGVSLEVKLDLGTADVRGMPDPDGERLDPIASGTRYVVTGRFYRWLQIRYDKSLTGYGWVFEDLVTMTGSDAIPDVDPYVTPSVTPVGGNIEATRAAVTLTPGAVETLDAQARLIAIPDGLSTEESENAGVLPTFTKPAELAPRDAPLAQQDSVTNAFEETLVRAATGQIPPIAPIVVLAGAGLIGMIISLWRR